MLIAGFKTQRYDFRKSKRTIFKLAYNVFGLGVSGGNLVQMFNKITKDEYSTKAQ